ncbi:MAG: hypothetical protein PWP21_347 [Thermosediminibacterales bacterium]|nr:hypothetical protein [Thermosediminibacterales bacterium]
MFESMGKIFLTLGIFLVIIGLVFIFGGKLGIGKLPGDIYIKRENFSFYFPIVTCLILSLILTLIFNLFRR